jgi:hypothetical protein
MLFASASCISTLISQHYYIKWRAAEARINAIKGAFADFMSKDISEVFNEIDTENLKEDGSNVESQDR